MIDPRHPSQGPEPLSVARERADKASNAPTTRVVCSCCKYPRDRSEGGALLCGLCDAPTPEPRRFFGRRHA